MATLRFGKYAPFGHEGETIPLDAPSPAVLAGTHDGGPHLFDLAAASVPATLPPSPLDFTQDQPNGLTVVSTFSGCGGSSLGYKLAGFDVRAALEFDKEAAESYRANFATPLIEADIRRVSGADLLSAAGLDVGELDVLDGSPPCAAFSTAGKREASWGKVRDYSGQKQRVDDLFDEYVRLVREIRPRAFVAENVSGLIKGVAKGEFKRILRLMRESGYRVEARLLDAKWLGVPQSRQRLIFVGVRSDLNRDPAFPVPFGPLITIRDVLPWISAVEEQCGFDGHRFLDADRPAGAVAASRPVKVTTRAIRDDRGAFGNGGDITDRPGPTMFSDLVVPHWIETDISRYAIGAEWDRLKPGESSERYRSLVRPDPDAPCPTVTCPPQGTFSPTAPYSSASVVHPTERRKFTIAELKRICAFPDDFVLTGSYAEQWERLGRAVPPLMMRAIARAIRDGVFAKGAD